MKKQTEKKLRLIVLYGLIALFAASTFLLYLPLGGPPTPTPAPALNGLPDAQGGTEQLPPEVQQKLLEQQQQGGQVPPAPGQPVPVTP